MVAKNWTAVYRWEKAVGDSIAVDEVICEIETDKTSVPVSALLSFILALLGGP